MNFLDIKRKLLPTSGYLMGGGGSGGGGGSNTTVTNSNIPTYAQPYVESMLGATQKQIFQGDTDAEGNFNITGFQPYRAYGGTYDAAGKQTAYDPSAGIAGFSPLQVQAQTGIKELQTPTEFTDALRYTGDATNAAKDPNLKYNPNTYANSYTAPANLGYTADTYGGANAGAAKDATSQGYTADTYGGANAGDAAQASVQGYAADNYGGASAGLADLAKSIGYTADTYGGASAGDARDATSEGYTASAADRIGATAAKLGAAPTAKAQTTGYAPTLTNYQMGGPERVNTRSFTDQGTADSYMSPYMQNVVDIQQREAQRQADIAGTQQQAAATQAGAFGGGRDAIMRAEAARNLATQKGDIQAQGLQAAYQQAQQQFNAEQGYGLQGQIANQQAGLTAGQQNLGANLGVQQLGTQTGLQVALANLGNQQQTELANQAQKGQYGLSQGQMSQQANMQTSSQAQQAALQDAAAKNQASQFGAAAANQAQLANAAAYNQMAQYNASNQQQAGMQNAALGSQASQFGSAASNQAALANAAAANQMAQYNASNQQQAGLANAAANTQANRSYSDAYNQAQVTNAAAANQMRQYNAGNLQQAGLSNAAAQNQAAQFGSAASNQAQLANRAAENQMAQYNASNLQQAGLAGAAAKSQASQFNAGQNLTSAQTAAQYGLGANQLTEQSKQFGAGNELNRIQTQLQGSNQYAQLANQRLASTQGILGMQSAAGAQQQAYQQQINNQAMQDYANAQQYPLMQLGTMSNMLRGLPMQAQNTSMYTAQPNFGTEAVGTTGMLMNYPYAKAPRGAEGGVVHKASGGLASIPQYDVGGSVRSKLEDMTTDDIEEYLKESDSRAIKQMAQAILRQKKGMAGGGIIAFREGDPVDEEIARAYNAPRETPRDVAEQRAAAVTGSNRPGTSSPPPRAAAPNPRAITAVPTQGQAQAQAQADPLMDFTEDKKLIAERQAELTTKRGLADRPQSAFIAEAQEGRKALGLDQNEALAVQRANVMAEKASLKDEAEYKRKMTLVKFFAAWGSTPGNTLVAGMKQFEKTIPEMIQNADDEKKARKETDKVIYELDNAVRLEKMGLYNEATASKNKAAELANALQEQVRKANEAMLKAQKDASVAGAQIKGQENVARIGAAGQFAVASENRAARAETAGVRKKDEEKQLSGSLFTLADKQIQETENKYEASKAAKSGEYYSATRVIERLEKQDKLEPNQQKQLDLANKKINELNAAHAARIAELNRKKDAAGREFYGSRYDAMTTSKDPAAPPAGYVINK